MYCKLARQTPSEWASREHFFSIAALLMRRCIIDAARERHTVKRGGFWVRVSGDRLAAIAAAEESTQDEEMLRLNSA